jgi:hypothetical protein
VFIATCIIVGCILSSFFYVQRHKIVSVNINYFEVDEASGIVREWLHSFTDNDGIFLGRISKDKKHEEYYLYINNLDAPIVGIESYSYDGLKIEVNKDNISPKKSKVFKINTLNKRAKYIILNGEKIETSSIEEIR